MVVLALIAATNGLCKVSKLGYSFAFGNGYEMPLISKISEILVLISFCVEQEEVVYV